MNLISEFERFQETYPRANPGRESETTAFIQHLAEEGTLGDATDVDWLRLAEKLGMTDDQYAAMFEGTASWIVPEPIEITQQESADWPYEVPEESDAGPEDGGAHRGTPEFKKLLRALDVEWVLNSRDLDRIEAIRMDGDEFEVRDRGSDVWETIAE